MQSIKAKTENAVTTAPKNDIKTLIKKMEPEIAKALPSVMTPERFTRIALSALSTNDKLANCTPKSFLGAMMTSAQLGMEVNTPLGQCYLIPYRNNGVMEVQFQLGYKGLIDLAYRSGEVVTIQAQTVYENDEFEYEYGLEPKLRHVPAKSDRGDPVYYYAVFRTKSGGYAFEVMSIDDVKAHRDAFSKAAKAGFSPWSTNFDEMAKKTVLKKVLKYAPMRTDFAKAVSTDETIKTTISEDMYSEPDETIVAKFAEESNESEG